MPGDTSKSRKMQNAAFYLGLAFLVAVVASPSVIAWGIQAKNANASASQVTEYGHVSLSEIGDAKLIFTNRTDATGSGVLQKVDLCPDIAKGLASSCITSTYLADTTNANRGTVGGITVTVSALPESGWWQDASSVWHGQQNNTDYSQDSYLQLTLKNETAGAFLRGTVVQDTYSFSVVSTGHYYPSQAATVTSGILGTPYHTSTSADFRLSSEFVYGSQVLFSTPKMNMVDGSIVGTNYTHAGSVGFLPLVQAKNDGTASTPSAPGYDNAVVIKLHGYYVGNAGNTTGLNTPHGTPGNQQDSDSVTFTTQYMKPNSPGITSYEDGFAIGAWLFGIVFVILGLLASPWFSMRDLDRYDRRIRGGPGGM